MKMNYNDRWKLAVACAMALALVVAFGIVSQYQMLKNKPAVVCK